MRVEGSYGVKIRVFEGCVWGGKWKFTFNTRRVFEVVFHVSRPFPDVWREIIIILAYVMENIRPNN